MWIAETIDLDDHNSVVRFVKNQSDKIKKLEKENEELKKALLFFVDVANSECSSNWRKDMENSCQRLFNCSYEEAKEKYDDYDGTWWELGGMTKKRYFLHKHLLRNDVIHDKICHRWLKGEELESDMNNLYNKYSSLKRENEQLKQQLKDKETEWLRNNTVWEQMPTNKRITTTLIRKGEQE